MTIAFVDWGGHRLKLTWMTDDNLPARELITSVHGLCLYHNELLMVDLNGRGWDFPGGHIEVGETPLECFKREAMEEGYVEGECTLLGYMEVNHEENPLWNQNSPYPKIGYQVFYRMEITKLYPFDAEFESTRRIFIKPDEARRFHKGWHSAFDEIVKSAIVQL